MSSVSSNNNNDRAIGNVSPSVPITIVPPPVVVRDVPRLAADGNTPDSPAVINVPPPAADGNASNRPAVP